MTTPYGPAPTDQRAQTPRYGAPPYRPVAPPAVTPTPSPGRTLLRVVLALVLVLAGVLAAAVTAFFAAITWSGCFLSCEPGGGDELAGGLLGLLAVALLVAGPVLARVVWRRTATRPVTLWAVLVLAGPGLLLLRVLPQLLPWA